MYTPLTLPRTLTLSLTLLLTLHTHVCESVVSDSNDPLEIFLQADTNDKYGVQDHYILDGAQFFAHWCNGAGGFKYANYTRNVTVVSVSLDTLTTQDQVAATNLAYTENIGGSTLVLSPISTPRTVAALNISEINQRINLVVGASADSLFKSNYKYMFSTVVPTSQIPQYSLSQFIGKVQNYVLFSTSDAVSTSVTTSVETYMNKSGITLLRSLELVLAPNVSNLQLDSTITQFFQNNSKYLNADLFVCTFPPDDFSSVAAAFQLVRPNVSAAAFVLPLTRTVEVGDIGDYWVGATQFDPSTDYGVSGWFGGTSSEFNDEFESFMGHPPDPYAATATAALMAYYVAVQLAGTVDSDAVKASLVDMPTFNSFLGDINFYPNGSSVYAKYLTFQFAGGIGQFINSSHSLIYPSPWPWVSAPSTPIPSSPPTPPSIKQHDKGLSIALGVITGICICLALAVLLLLLMKREMFLSQGIVYSALIIIGILYTYAAALVTLPTPTNSLCLAFPWLLGIGFTLVFGNLLTKTWVLLQIYRSANRADRMRSLHVTVSYITKLLIGAMLLEIVFLIVWSAVDPPRAKLRDIVDTNNHTQQLMCTRTNSAFWAVFIAYKGVWLVAGVIVAVMTRHIRNEFKESKQIVLSIYNCTMVLIIAVILAYLLPNVPDAIVAIQVVAILIAFTFTLVVLFYSPVSYFIFGGKSEELEMRTRSNTPSISNPPSKEEDSEY